MVTEPDTDIAIAFDSVTMLRDPFPLTNILNFSPDNRTRVMLFAMNLDLPPGEAPALAVVVRIVPIHGTI